MKKGSGARLNAERIKEAILLLDGWTGRLTWDLYLRTLSKQIHRLYTRAAMLRNSDIRTAWELAKRRAGDHEGGHGSVGMAQMREQVRELRNAVDRLEAKEKALLLQYLTWTQNAANHGLSIDQLSRPLPLNDRDIRNARPDT